MTAPIFRAGSAKELTIIYSEETMVKEKRQFHEVTQILPLMEKEEFEDLKNDISQHGLREPIWIDQNGAIIDGRHRYRACIELGIRPEYRVYGSDSSLIIFVMSLNFKRRHLTQTQKAFVAIDVEAYYAREAKMRQREAGKLYGEQRLKHEDGKQDLNLFDTEAPEVVEKIPQPPAKQKLTDGKSRTQAAKTVGVNPRYVSDAKRIAATAPDVAEFARLGKLAMPDAIKIANLAAPLRNEVLKRIEDGSNPTEAIRETVRETVRAELESIEAMVTKAIEGVYDVIVIDPPWPMEKLERDSAPTQVGFDYPTMTLEEIRAVEVPCADNCHVMLWTTQKFLPNAFDIVSSWGLKYVCTLVWHKPGGFQPFGQPQYNCEFVLYCRKGSPKFLDLKDFPTCFNAPRTRSSEKPEAFYEVIRRVTGGRRVDLFNRRKIEGFETWGKEAA